VRCHPTKAVHSGGEKMKRFTAVAILLVMLCSVFASSPVLSAGEPKTAEPERLGEELELRTKNSETYRLSDGTYECVVFAEDKYYETEAGSLVEIDNSVIASDHVFGGKEYGFTNAANSTHVYFSDNKPSVMISAEKGSVSFEIETDHGVNPSVGGLKDTESISGYLLSGECFISYPEVFENADLVYEVKNGLLKEYIVLNDASAPKEFTFSFDTEGYDIAYTENGTVGFYDGNGELVFELGDLFAVDSADAYTDELTYTIVEKVEENVDITVSLSEDYVNDPERAFPILIDPSVMISGSNKTQDSYVSSKNPTTNYYLNTYIRMGWDSNYYIRRTYIRFDLPSVVPSGHITKAYLSLKKKDCGNEASLNAYRVTGSWTSSTITWNNKPSYIATDASETAELTSSNWYKFYVTEIVRKWYNGSYQNYGFMVRNSSESGTGNWSTCYSSEAASPNKPELKIIFNMPSYYTGMYIGDSDGDTNMQLIKNAVMGRLNYNGYYGSDFHSITKTQLESELTSKNAFFCITHGDWDRIRLTNDVWFTISDLNAISNSDLSDLSFVFLGACLTASGGVNATNLVNTFYSKGVDVVIGFSSEISIEVANFWIKEFLMKLADGVTIQAAFDVADEATAEAYYLNDFSGMAVYANRVIRGSANTVPFPPQY
jgi:hypothetical protein